MHQVHDYRDETETTDIERYTQHEDLGGLVAIPWAMTFKEFVLGGFAIVGPTSMAAAIGLSPIMQLVALICAVVPWIMWWSEQSSMRSVDAQNQWALEDARRQLAATAADDEQRQLAVQQ